MSVVQWCRRTEPIWDSESLTHSEDADQPDERHGGRARREERLHHISAEGQAHVRGHSWPAKQTEKKALLERSWKLTPVGKGGNGKHAAARANNLMKRNSAQRRRNAGRGPSVSSRYV